MEYSAGLSQTPSTGGLIRSQRSEGVPVRLQGYVDPFKRLHDGRQLPKVPGVDSLDELHRRVLLPEDYGDDAGDGDPARRGKTVRIKVLEEGSQGASGFITGASARSSRPKKQRHTAKRIGERLRAEIPRSCHPDRMRRRHAGVLAS